MAIKDRIESSLIRDIVIKSRRPVNGLAARVTMETEQIEEINKSGSVVTIERGGDTRVRPEYRTKSFSLGERNVMKELIGKKYGHLLVLGVSLDRPKRWVVKCSCGNYTFRTAKTIRRAFEKAACTVCEIDANQTHHQEMVSLWDTIHKTLKD